jgi:putative peptidoglycan lipid II flippase
MLRIPRLIVAAAIMAGMLYGAIRLFAAQLASDSPFYIQAATLGAIVLTAMLVYFTAAFGLGGADIGMIRRNIKRGGGTPAVMEPSPDP